MVARPQCMRVNRWAHAAMVHAALGGQGNQGGDSSASNEQEEDTPGAEQEKARALAKAREERSLTNGKAAYEWVHAGGELPPALPNAPSNHFPTPGLGSMRPQCGYSNVGSRRQEQIR